MSVVNSLCRRATIRIGVPAFRSQPVAERDPGIELADRGNVGQVGQPVLPDTTMARSFPP
jgi:hypothetical protein